MSGRDGTGDIYCRIFILGGEVLARTEKKIIAESPQMKKILQMIEYIKDVDSSVLLPENPGHQENK